MPSPEERKHEDPAPARSETEELHCPEDVDWIYDVDNLVAAGGSHFARRYGLKESSAKEPHFPFILDQPSAVLWERELRQLAMATGEKHLVLSAFSEREKESMLFHARVAGYREEGLPRIVASFQKIDAASHQSMEDNLQQNWLYLLHEIKNPLSLLQASDQIDAQWGETSAPESEGARLRRFAIRCLEDHLRNGVLLATQENSIIPNRPEPFDLKFFLEDIKAVYAPLLELQNNRLELDLNIEDVRTVRLDRTLLSQLLNNLLLNKLNLLENQRIRIRVESAASSSDGSGPMIHFAIEDEGPPFPEEVLAGETGKIQLDRLYHLEPGSGLGLGICRRVVTILGGDMRLHNDPPLTRIRISLPLS
jgi:signal transduction histidine kinase